MRGAFFVPCECCPVVAQVTIGLSEIEEGARVLRVLLVRLREQTDIALELLGAHPTIANMNQGKLWQELPGTSRGRDNILVRDSDELPLVSIRDKHWLRIIDGPLVMNLVRVGVEARFERAMNVYDHIGIEQE